MRQTIKESRVGPKGPDYREWRDMWDADDPSYVDILHINSFHELMEVILRKCNRALSTKMALHLVNKSRLQLANNGQLKITSTDIHDAIDKEYQNSGTLIQHSPGIFGEFYRKEGKESGNIDVNGT